MIFWFGHLIFEVKWQISLWPFVCEYFNGIDCIKEPPLTRRSPWEPIFTVENVCDSESICSAQAWLSWVVAGAVTAMLQMEAFAKISDDFQSYQYHRKEGMQHSIVQAPRSHIVKNLQWIQRRLIRIGQSWLCCWVCRWIWGEIWNQSCRNWHLLCKSWPLNTGFNVLKPTHMLIVALVSFSVRSLRRCEHGSALAGFRLLALQRFVSGDVSSSLSTTASISPAVFLWLSVSQPACGEHFIYNTRCFQNHPTGMNS